MDADCPIKSRGSTSSSEPACPAIKASHGSFQSETSVPRDTGLSGPALSNPVFRRPAARSLLQLPTWSVCEGLNAGLSASQDQGVDVVCALIGVDRLEVQHMAYHAVFVTHAITAMHVSGIARDLERLAT